MISRIFEPYAKLAIILSVLVSIPMSVLYTKSQSYDLDVNSDMPFLLALEKQAEFPTQDITIQNAFSIGLINALGIWPPISDQTVQDLTSDQRGAVLWLPASPEILQGMQTEFPRFVPDTTYLDQQQAKMQLLTSSLGKKAWWDIMPEWDSSDWWIDRPEFPIKPFVLSSRTRQQSYEAFKQYYFDLTRLPIYLQQTPAQRGFNSASVSGYTRSAHYAYEFGIDLAMVERNNDAIGDIQTGISFTRGAARQYDRPWGVDISAWRSAGQSVTAYNDSMQRIGGWSESYHKRHLYISYMSGANIVHLEPVRLYNSAGTVLNPLGQLVKEFADFSLRRHPDIGEPYVPTAIMLDFYHGWEPRHGQYQSGSFNSVWYWSVPYQDGDYMLDNLFAMIYPDHWKSGTTPGAPWTSPAEYNQMVLNGLDTRPYEPMGNSRWGDTFDVILSNASLSALQHYKTIILAGNVKLDGNLRPAVQQWVNEGGTLVLNVQQVTAADEAFLGVKLSGTQRSSTSSTWLASNTAYTEPLYHYTVVTPTTASVIASNDVPDPIITKRTIGNGTVYLTTPYYLQDTNKANILSIGQKLIDTVVNQCAIAQVSGPAVEWIVNKGAGKIVVTVINNSGSNWDGSIILDEPTSVYTTTEWLEDTAASSTAANGKVTISVSVPAYDLRVYALEIEASQINLYLPLILKNYKPTPEPPTPPPPPPHAGPDLVVTNISVVPDPPEAGQPATVYVTVRNQGNQSVAYGNNFYVDFYLDNVPAPLLVGDIQWGVQGSWFGVGENRTLSNSYSFTAGPHHLYAQADTDNTVVEADETNNTWGPVLLTMMSLGGGEVPVVPVVIPTPGRGSLRPTPTPEP